MNNQIDYARTRAVNPLVPAVGDRMRMQALEAQVEDLKYTLHNVLQDLVTLADGRPEDNRQAALVKDARAALRTRPVDYLD